MTIYKIKTLVIKLLKSYINHTHTLTPDNGKVFACHQHTAKQLDTKVYFSNPYSSWKRGLNEHTNGLLRHYLPKQTPLAVFESGIINQQKVALRI